MVPGHADLGHLSDPGHHRHSAHALLPSLRPAGIRRHEGPAVCRVLRTLSQEFASLVGAAHGVSRIRTHVQGFLSWRVPDTARIQLGRRHRPASYYAPPEPPAPPASL